MNLHECYILGYNNPKLPPGIVKTVEQLGEYLACDKALLHGASDAVRGLPPLTEYNATRYSKTGIRSIRTMFDIGSDSVQLFVSDGQYMITITDHTVNPPVHITVPVVTNLQVPEGTPEENIPENTTARQENE